jgi:F-type H+-transporting ATPase subunit gamma
VFDHLRESPDFQDILPICRLVIDGFREGVYDKVFVVYTDYKSSVVQIPTIRQLLPITQKNIHVILGELDEKVIKSETSDELSLDRTLFEPNEEIILHTILPRLLEVQLYQAILESSASEYSARMVAMKSASDAAGDMIRELSREYNKNRQAGITREIAEIVGGAVALE